MRSPSLNLTISTTSLSPSAFEPFGEVIQNPATHDEVDGNGQWRLQHQLANQGTATKWVDVTHLNNHYEKAWSKKPAKAVVNLFVCRPRVLTKDDNGREVFQVGIMERHPYTPQTFVPLGVGKEDVGNTRYLVIVAPTLPATLRAKEEKTDRPYPVDAPRARKRSLKERLLGARPNPFTNDYVPATKPTSSTLPSSQQPKGSGLPDLKNIRAFIARGDQALTYGPGTWHAPMVVLGESAVEFVVVQYANGVGDEDCQECELDAVDGDGIVVDVGRVDEVVQATDASKPGYMRAKL